MSTRRPLSLELVGRLGAVMSSGRASAVDRSHGLRRLQEIRYTCGSEAFCRLVRVQVVVGSEVLFSLTPAGQRDRWPLVWDIPEGQPFELRVIRDPRTDPKMLPAPFPDADYRVEAFG